jgi:hypothetical protein
MSLLIVVRGSWFVVRDSKDLAALGSSSAFRTRANRSPAARRSLDQLPRAFRAILSIGSE